MKMIDANGIVELMGGGVPIVLSRVTRLFGDDFWQC